MAAILKKFDWVLMFSVFILAVASLISLASSSPEFFLRQLVWYLLTLLIIFAAPFFDWRRFLAEGWFRYGLYFLSLALLLVSNFQSRTIRGTKSWLVVGDFQFQPAEIAKVALIFILAGFFSRRYLEAWLGKNIFKSLVITLLPVGLIAAQPDLGSAVILVAVWVGFLLLSGIHLKRFVLGIFLALIGSLLLWNFYLKPYQKDRIKAFLFPETDPFGISYNVIQSKIAIGSAGLLGKGFKNGTQTQLKFLPEAKTDFIFAAFVEEWGILGGLVLIVAFLVLVSRIIFVGLRTRSNDFKFLSLGTAVVLLTQFFINLGSNLGFTPVAGIPFPFLSYGGSSLLTSGLLVGIIQHIKLESS